MPRSLVIKAPKYWGFLAGALIGILAIFGLDIHQTTAVQTPGGRYRTVEVTINQYNWQVISNQTGKKLCDITIEYDRQPSGDEVMAACADLFEAVVLPTTAPDTTPVPIPPYYDPATFLQTVHLVRIDVHNFKRTVKILLQDMTTNIVVPDGLLTAPYVVITAFEPEIDYHITALHINLNSVHYVCSQARCRVPIQRDATITFWADSSFGDESEHTTATIRVSVQNGSTKLTLDSIFPVKLFADSCSEIWGAPIGVPIPDWAVFPSSPENLHTNKKYYYLAAQLIKNQVVNTSDCPGAGLSLDGSANGCGMDRVANEVVLWQNQYDTMIWSSALNIGIPPVLIKSLIEIESQFWPSNIRYFMYEFGLAQINQYGADVALRWDNDLYNQICNGIFYNCSLAYASLPPSMQAIVRGGLVRSVNSDCPTCQYGLDYTKSVQTIPMIARIMRSNCRQANFIFNQHDVKPSYENGWKFTLVSYHSGYFCLDDAISKTIANGEAVNWNNVSNHINANCVGAADYVNNFWSNVQSFSANQIKPDLSGANLPLVSIAPTAVPTPTATPFTAHSTIRVLVFIDKNNNGSPDPGEGVDNLTVSLILVNGNTFSKKTTAGQVIFDMSGVVVDSNVKVLLPTQLLSKNLLVPATGESLVTFQLQQSILPPVLP